MLQRGGRRPRRARRVAEGSGREEGTAPRVGRATAATARTAGRCAGAARRIGRRPARRRRAGSRVPAEARAATGASSSAARAASAPAARPSRAVTIGSRGARVPSAWARAAASAAHRQPECEAEKWPATISVSQWSATGVRLRHGEETFEPRGCGAWASVGHVTLMSLDCRVVRKIGALSHPFLLDASGRMPPASRASLVLVELFTGKRRVKFSCGLCDQNPRELTYFAEHAPKTPAAASFDYGRDADRKRPGEHG